MRKHNVLLRDEPDGDAVADGGVEETADLFRRHVSRAFLKPTKRIDYRLCKSSLKRVADAHVCLCELKQNSPFGHGWNIVRVVPDESLQLRGEHRVFFQILHLRVRRAPQEAVPEPIENTRDVWVRADYEG